MVGMRVGRADVGVGFVLDSAGIDVGLEKETVGNEPGNAIVGMGVLVGTKVALGGATVVGVTREASLHAIRNINIPRKTPALKSLFILTRFLR